MPMFSSELVGWLGNELTYRSNDLRFQSILILKSTSKVMQAALPIRCSIRDTADVIEHVPTCEQENADQADSGPEIPVLDEGEDVRCGYREERDQAENGGDDEGDFEVVDRTDERWMGDIWHLAGEPGVDWVCFVGAVVIY